MDGDLATTENDDFTEPGRYIATSEPVGRIQYCWPPEGRFEEIWDRITTAFPDEAEREEATELLEKWRQVTASSRNN